MPPKIFITGITGYIGGSVFHALSRRHPEYQITAFVRTTPRNFANLYPDVTLIHGTWDDREVLTAAATEADVVIQCGSSDHLGAVVALLDGALRKDKAKTTYYIHLSGTAVISDYGDVDGAIYRGRSNPKVYDDLINVEEVISRPDGVPHRHTDKIIQEYAQKHGDVLKTAIVCPPDLYGRGYGPGKQDSVYFPVFVNEVKNLGYPFYCHEGGNTRGWAHIDDLSELYTRLIEAAVNKEGEVSWGREAYFFATTQEATQKDIATATGKVLHAKGVISSPEAISVSEETIAPMWKELGIPNVAFYLFANNSRSKPFRAEKELRWKPRAPTLWQEIEKEVEACIS
ncbi:hypothetical protein LTR84_010671 [Exophiala bonariae]|uniref:NAD-dependent epimerase/dehydratase domain-containing protein n=1 Tax=Exophiala bonariae TaxID=1690606 RepID=A0AAV9MSV9_9EURO|nr:hypothetical protein LTR84_010671 [Exophiala bonariae]